MARRHGITANTYKRLIIDSGAVYKNYGESGEVLLGATRGGSTFTVESEQRVMEVDGAIGDVKGDKRIVRHVASLAVNLIEISKDALLMALPGAIAADYPVAPATATHDLITQAADLTDSNYLTNITIVGNTTMGVSKYIILKLSNALADGNLEIAMADKEESVVAVTFKAHYLPTDLDTRPFQIYWPKA